MMYGKYYYFSAAEEELGHYDPDEAMGNPLKGLFGSPWYNNYNASKNVIPAALEWYYLGFDDLMINDPDVVGNDLAFNWTTLENALEDSASRSMHVVFTVVCHYPGQPLMLPSYLIDNPSLLLHSYNDFLGDGLSPDYGDPLLLKAIEQLIVALGERYDGDKRIASVHAGLLGFWGEWHTYPHHGWVPDESKRKVTQWYQNAFSTTKVQVRYPDELSLDAGFGLSDGSFAYHTLDGSANGDVEQFWYFWSKVEDHNASDTFWKKSFMSGETRPEIQSIVFEPDYPAGTHERQDFMECVNTTHTSFMFHHDAFANQYQGQELQNALFAHSRMGYNFIISNVNIGIPKHSILTEIDSDLPTINDVDTVSVDVTVQQKGIAPFYYPLRLELHCYDAKLQKTKIRRKRGVQSIIKQNSWKTFTFSNITHSCLSNLTFTLDSPYAYPGRPVRFAQRGLHNHETTARVSIFNVPIPTNQNLIEAMDFYKISPVPTMVPTTTPSPTITDTIQMATFTPSPMVSTILYVSPTQYPIATSMRSRNITISPPTNPTQRMNNTTAPTKYTDNTAPIHFSVNPTIDFTGSYSSNIAAPVNASLAKDQQSTSIWKHTNIGLIVTVSIVMGLTAILLVCRCCKSMRHKSS